jgi:hypothetical protein
MEIQYERDLRDLSLSVERSNKENEGTASLFEHKCRSHKNFDMSNESSLRDLT